MKSGGFYVFFPLRVSSWNVHNDVNVFMWGQTPHKCLMLIELGYGKRVSTIFVYGGL